MKRLLIALLFAPLTCIASQPTALVFLKQDEAANTRGLKLVWDVDIDFELDKDQLKMLKATPKGETDEMAALVIKLGHESGRFNQIPPGDVPVALSCPNRMVNVVKQSLAARYQKSGCYLIQDSI